MPQQPAHPLATDAALRRRLISLARRWLGSGQDAPDLVQDTYLRTALGPLPPDEAGRQAWLTTVLHHLCIDQRRRQSRLEALLSDRMPADWWCTEPIELDSPEHLAAQGEQVEQALTHLTQQLTPAEVAAVLLHEVFELSHLELGVLSGRTEVASRQHLRRTLQRLRSTTRSGRNPPVPTDEDSAELRALCRQALVQHDPSGLIALLGATRPLALSAPPVAATVRPPHPQPAPGRSQTRIVQAQGRLMLAVSLGDQFLCLLPLGCTAPAEA